MLDVVIRSREELIGVALFWLVVGKREGGTNRGGGGGVCIPFLYRDSVRESTICSQPREGGGGKGGGKGRGDRHPGDENGGGGGGCSCSIVCAVE